VRGSDVEEFWGWCPQYGGKFSVKSMYSLLEDLVLLDPRLGEAEERVFVSLWKSPWPLKVIAFSCKLLCDRIPSRVNLAKRNVLDQESPTRCVFCDNAEETSLHFFFLHRNVSFELLSKVNWLGISLTTPQNLFIQMPCLIGESWNKKIHKGHWLIGTRQFGYFGSL